ncbi:hypothetical protein BC939DRAFT_478008 [Gamsiella multidivaricata]|uniref:uncharacterized protein n=1 Tax=Gamsiella multidivaricata TaxID=101098 RepID=UPI00221F9600|nr:uncharacterized protein BC939DRAFT_478008 [Gamsiella multidivaricata]KAI7822020.1 hypothetical protein BC939DRAFT_478008 [Gamsiella multidivaricata]
MLKVHLALALCVSALLARPKTADSFFFYVENFKGIPCNGGLGQARSRNGCTVGGGKTGYFQSVQYVGGNMGDVAAYAQQNGNECVLPPKEAARVLGVWVNSARSTTPTTRTLETEVAQLCNIMSRKAITDRIATTIVNSVLIPKILYRSTIQVISPSRLKKLTGK